jgi:hypothetical protein
VVSGVSGVWCEWCFLNVGSVCLFRTFVSVNNAASVHQWSQQYHLPVPAQADWYRHRQEPAPSQPARRLELGRDEISGSHAVRQESGNSDIVTSCLWSGLSSCLLHSGVDSNQAQSTVSL